MIIFLLQLCEFAGMYAQQEIHFDEMHFSVWKIKVQLYYQSHFYHFVVAFSCIKPVWWQNE